MPQSRTKTESHGAAFYGNGKTAAVVDITDKMMGGKAKVKKPFRMAAKDGVGEIFIFDDIGAGFFMDGITAKSFADDLKALGAVRTLNIFINSPGGSVFDGVAIYNQIKRHKARVVVHIDGIVASIASVIAMAGDEINIAANGFVMIHKPRVAFDGTDSEHIEVAAKLTKIGDSILNTYAARTGTPENVIADMMAAETWMNAEEAVEHGFADNITDEVAIAAHFDLGQFQNVPEDVAAKIDLANNPPKIEWTEVGGYTTGAVLETGDKGGPVLMEGAAARDAILSLDPDAKLVSIAGEPEPDPEPRTPSMAITKMRQRIQKRGIVPKNDDETAATA